MGEKVQLLKKRIIKNLYYCKTFSSAELGLKIDKSLPLTIKLLNELMEDGVVIETGYAPSTGGRRPVMYSLDKNVLFVISVAMDQFITRIAILNMNNEMAAAEVKFELPIAGNPDAECSEGLQGTWFQESA